MAWHLQPMRVWKKTAVETFVVNPSQKVEIDESGISQIRRGELVEVPQGGDKPSKFLYKDLGGHMYWASLMPFELEESND